ncbi:MAG: rhomboid family intramembrane serine protease [Thermodesulfovibrionales bacterium]|nr:rhomboid family intramembrane serine protease [Thermodesulfovibrionales bacterium]
MIPYKDDNPVSIVPYFTICIIALNVMVFIWELASPTGAEEIAYSFGAIPHSLITFERLQPIHPAASIFTAMFLHAGFFHLGGNMLYLWIFGNNIEDRLGHLRFLLFYLMGGIAAAYAHTLTAPDSTVPMIGASGAVSAVLGAYILLFPRARVYTIMFFGFFYQILRVPALIVIGFWAIIQLVNGLLTSGAAGAKGGVAWAAHIGGFVFGVLVIRIFMIGRRRPRSGSSLP